MARSRTALQQTWDLVCTCFGACRHVAHRDDAAMASNRCPTPPQHSAAVDVRDATALALEARRMPALAERMEAFANHGFGTARTRSRNGHCPAAPETVGLRQSVAGTINDTHWVGYPKLGRPLSLAGGDSVALHDPFFTARETSKLHFFFNFPAMRKGLPKRGVCFPSRHACSGAMFLSSLQQLTSD